MTDLIPLASTDLGRPLTHFAPALIDVDLKRSAERVLQDLAINEMEVTTVDNKWYQMTVLPYRTLNNVIEGVVITFVDITARKRAEENVRRLSTLVTVVQDSYDAITIQDEKGRILAWNRGAERIYGYSEEQALEMNIGDIIPENRKREYADLVKSVIEGDVVTALETERLTQDGRRLKVWLTLSTLVDDRGHPVSVASTERDITSIAHGDDAE